MFSLFIREKLYIGEACWAFLFGVIIAFLSWSIPGPLDQDSHEILTLFAFALRVPSRACGLVFRRRPYGANIFNPHSWGSDTDEASNNITIEFTRIVIAIGVFAVGVELPKKYMYRHWRSLFFLLVPVMTWGWFVSAALIYALIPGLNFLSSLAIAACLTPTDPILAAAIIGGKYADKHVPSHLRHLLAAESASNDGAAYPFLYFALYLTLNATPGEAMKDWFLVSWLYQIVLSVIWGSMLGYGFRHLMKFCEGKDLIDRQSYVAQYVSLALLTIGTTTLLGSDDLLASSCVTEASVFSSVVDLLLNTAAFVFVGAWMPFDSFSDNALSLSVGRLICIAVLVLLLRRLPVIIALYKWIPDIKSLREALFSGHFGPIGIGAIFTSTLAAQTLPRPQNPPANQAERLAAMIQPVVAFMVLCSVLIHGLSIPFFSLGRRVTTVTRTWSRQPSLPDWALHTRRVERAEDVVINRDPASIMERGQVSENEKAGIKDRESEAMVHVEDEKSGRAAQREDNPEADDLTVAMTETEEAKADNAPDGMEIYAEWKEGPHLIIERRKGPGEEVEVEVQRNAYGPSEAERITRAFRGGRAAVYHSAGAFLGGVMRHVPHDIEAGVKGVLHGGDNIGVLHTRPSHPHQQGEDTVKTSEPTPVFQNLSTEPEEIAVIRQADEDEWVSDQSATEDAQIVKDHQRVTKGASGRSPKKKRFDRQRSSAHPRIPLPAPIDTSGSVESDTAPTTALSTSTRDFPGSSIPEIPSSSTDAVDDEPRGRTPPASASSTFSARRRPRHMRIVSLRGSETGSREVSPARSIRWADAGVGASPATARWPQSPSAQGSRAPSPRPSIPGDSPENELG
ncbi:Sodium/hydrogen exchanger family-domain-containing protein [Multifurca ochricompacta]|uniref:Sodium/hydrogen exchanger family-domain-containing protein n=1 Tax=Multifurca ochricompacta TaxID=376703 RepID=A0AAD4QMW4_9AGAM|nr:Sodium/hydrogen exchanger family-domain-containing protein [Multifurca ochricompacta]